MHTSNWKKRTGKTQKDHASGAHANRFNNRAKRVTWQQDSKKEKFPKEACNGKKNRSRYTSKENHTVIL